MHLNRSLGRGLRILATLNSEGEHTVASIARDVRLPRTTTFRILSTLVAEGFVARDSASDTFHHTALVRSLFDGFDDTSLLVQVANPLVAELGQRLIWPVTIATLSGTTVLVRQTTDDASPLAVTHYAPGYRMPISESASGLVLLAFSRPHQRQMLLDLLYQPSTTGQQPLPRAQLERRIKQVQALGHARIDKPGRMTERSSLAVPVRANEDTVAALVVRFARSAVKQQMVLDSFLPELRRTAGMIVAAFNTQQPGPGASGEPPARATRARVSKLPTKRARAPRAGKAPETHTSR